MDGNDLLRLYPGFFQDFGGKEQIFGRIGGLVLQNDPILGDTGGNGDGGEALGLTLRPELVGVLQKKFMKIIVAQYKKK